MDYNAQDTVKNNPVKGTGAYVTDNMDKAQTIRCMMSILIDYPYGVSSDFRSIITVGLDVYEARVEIRLLSGSTTDNNSTQLTIYGGTDTLK